MNSTISKIFVLVLIFLGEALAIFVEMLGARTSFATAQPFVLVFLKMFLLMAVAGGFLILGYMLGFQVFKNIWIVSVASITSILIIEPILAWTIFHQVPTSGALIGFILGALGLVISIVF